jgi:hypothetical protein
MGVLRLPGTARIRLVRSQRICFAGMSSYFLAVLATRIIPITKPFSTHSMRCFPSGNPSNPKMAKCLPALGSHRSAVGVPLPGRRPLATRAELTLNIELRHNAIQRRLYEALVEEHGEDCVGIEYEARGGGRVDAIVRTASERVLYEIKTASTARACVREALGQLLDYGCWPGRDQATRLVIVGAAATTEEVRRFLDRLSGLVPLRIEYRQVSIEDGSEVN